MKDNTELIEAVVRRILGRTRNLDPGYLPAEVHLQPEEELVLETKEGWNALAERLKVHVPLSLYGQDELAIQRQGGLLLLKLELKAPAGLEMIERYLGV